MVSLTFLGTGTSMGVPIIGCGCEVCTSPDPRDRRFRTAVLVRKGSGVLWVDAPPELRLQAVRAGVDRIDALLLTHDHADHIAGLDDVRPFNYFRPDPGPLDVHGPPETLASIRTRFNYIFEAASPNSSQPALILHPWPPEEERILAGIRVRPLPVWHGTVRVYGYLFDGRIAYITDVKAIPPETARFLEGVPVLILGVLRYRPHPNHLSLEEALETVARLRPGRAYLTHLSHAFRHGAVEPRLPAGVHLAYDGLTVEA